MRDVEIKAVVPRADADYVFATICRFEAYAALTDAVQGVEVRPTDDGDLESTWSVSFRNGLLRWTERDVIDPTARTIAFDQTEGDFDDFHGSWQVEEAQDDVVVWFRAGFDLGIPSLAPIIDPIAERALRENMQTILRGLTGERTAFPDAGAASSQDLAVLGHGS